MKTRLGATRVLLLVLFSLLLPSATSGTAAFSFDIDGDRAVEYELVLHGWMGNAKPFVMSRTYRHARYDLYVYRQNGKLFKLLLVRYSDGSVAYFARNERSRRNTGEALTLIVKHPTQTAFRALTDKGIAPAEPSRHIRATLFAVSPTHHYRVGRPRALKPLGYTVHQEVVQTRPVVFERLSSEFRFHIPLGTEGGVVQETWGLLAKQPLIPWQNRDAVDALVRLERESAHVMRADGLYTRTPYDPGDPAFNYVPAAPRSFYRNPANVAGLQALPWLDVRGAHYFDLVLIHMAYTAVQTQNENGYWETHPKSNWLAREYRIGHRYMDNRRNVDNATFLHRFAQRKPDPAIRASLAKWDRYHAQYIQAYGIPTSRKGLLLPDYVGGPGGRTTHVSLNHHVANMNYLYETYLTDQNPQKRALAERLLQGVVDTALLWVKPNHDLHYALTPDLRPYPAKDYPFLTRDDLVFAQALLGNLYGHKHPALQHLIDEKNRWIHETYPDRPHER